MVEFRPGRLAGVLAGTIGILAIGVYGPVTLLAPLPAVQAEILSPSTSQAPVAPPTLPADGASAVLIGTDRTPVATAGIADTVPMAGVAKLVTALVVMDAKPIDVGDPGPSMMITPEDFTAYVTYANDGARTVPVFAGESWTERELLQGVLLASGNNLADTLVRWAFGSTDAYLTAADAWLAENGLKNTHVADTTGLDEDSVSTATDAAQLAALVDQQPALNEIFHNPAPEHVGGRGVDNITDDYAADGVFGLSRSFTDAAGVCFLFTMTVGEGDDAVTLAGAFLREPDYDTLEADLAAFASTAAAGSQTVPIVEKGTAYARFRAPWGQVVNGVAALDVTRSAWLVAEKATHVDVEEFSTAATGALVGHVSVEGGASAPLKLDAAMRDPGPGWRLMNPIPMIGSLIAQNSGSG